MPYLSEVESDMHRFEAQDDPLFSEAVHICEGCNHSAPKLYPVPEYELMLCERCRDEAMEAIARDPLPQPQCQERVGAVLMATSVAELRDLLKTHECECVRCGSTKKTVLSDRLVLNTPGSACCELPEVA